LTSQSNIVLRELCDSDTQVYLRILDQKLSRRLKFSAFQVDRENSPAQGFNFSMELSGQYSDFIPFLLNLENKFSFFQIKSMKMWPLSADNKYIGTVRMKLDGWLW